MLDRAFSVGLTGGIGSGKSTVAEMFAVRGTAIIDTDLIAHQLTAPDGAAMTAIRAQFGDAYILSTGAMDRARMRDLVFSDTAAKARLEAILHPLIRAATAAAAESAAGVYPMLVVPLLVESGGWRQRVSRILVVDCPEEMQIRRVEQRNALDVTQIRAIMASQAQRADRLAAADDVVVNDGDLSKLETQVDRLHALYASMAQTRATKPP